MSSRVAAEARPAVPYEGLCRIDIACNDPDNGLFDDRAAAIQIYDLLELTSHDMKGPRFRVADGDIVIHGVRFPYLRSKDWFGNWVWNAYWLGIPEAVALLAFVHRRGKFGVDMGEERLFNLWKKREPFDAHDKEFLGRLIAMEALHSA